jgi:hypothetical protein
MRLKRILWISVVAASLSVSILPAQQHYDRRFARISYIDGNVVFRHAGDSDWVAGSINTPLQEQDRIYVPLKSRAELEFDDGSFLRMAEDTEVRIIRLDPGQIRVELPVGLTTIRHASDVDFHIDSPSASVHLLQKGDYRIEVPQNGSLDVMVRKGTAEILRGGETLRVRRNEAISVPVEATAQAAYRPIDREDAWDNWNDRRDASVMASASRRYIPSDVYLGAYELDRYGTWVDIADYGYCWRPLYVSYGWSPYRYGRWIHRPHWGWTWVSYEEWGWLPYHYGRWYYPPVHNWCWIPHGGFGLSIGFNFWSPGLVHFYHYGGGMHWVPLGPRDAHYGRNYFYNVNNVTYNNYYIRNIQNVRNVNLEHLPRDRGPQNVNVHNAIVSLDEKEFIGGRSGSRMRVP